MDVSQLPLTCVLFICAQSCSPAAEQDAALPAKETNWIWITGRSATETYADERIEGAEVEAGGDGVDCLRVSDHLDITGRLRLPGPKETSVHLEYWNYWGESSRTDDFTREDFDANIHAGKLITDLGQSSEAHVEHGALCQSHFDWDASGHLTGSLECTNLWYSWEGELINVSVWFECDVERL